MRKFKGEKMKRRLQSFQKRITAWGLIAGLMIQNTSVMTTWASDTNDEWSYSFDSELIEGGELIELELNAPSDVTIEQVILPDNSIANLDDIAYLATENRNYEFNVYYSEEDDETGVATNSNATASNANASSDNNGDVTLAWDGEGEDPNKKNTWETMVFTYQATLVGNHDFSLQNENKTEITTVIYHANDARTKDHTKNDENITNDYVISDNTFCRMEYRI